MIPAAIIAIAFLLAAPCQAWTAKVAMTPPTTSDASYCGAKDAALTDLAGYDFTLRTCRGDSLTFQTGLVDSADFSIADSIHVLILDVWARDISGHRSCDRRTLVMAHPPEAAPPPDTTSGGIQGRYYAGTSRGGLPLLTRIDGPIDFSWGLGSPSPEVPPDQWSVEWVGSLMVPATGAWTLYVRSEDGAQLLIDGTLGINRWGIQPVTEWSWTVNLTVGTHRLQLNYMANNGNSECHLSLSGPNFTKQIVPRGMLR